MIQDRPFKICILLSACVHFAVLYQWPLFQLMRRPEIPSQRIELTYFKEDFIEEAIVKDLKPIISIKRKASKENTETREIEKIVTGNISNSEIKQEKKVSRDIMSESYQVPKREDYGAVESVPEEGMALENYYLKVREKIKSSLEKYGKRFTLEGEVYVKFIINRDGELKDLMLYKSSSGGLYSLETIAIKSVKDASPFPPFEDGIKKAELPLKLPIRFTLHP